MHSCTMLAVLVVALAMLGHAFAQLAATYSHPGETVIVAVPPKCYNITASLCGASGPPTGCADIMPKPGYDWNYPSYTGGGRGACLRGTFLCQGLSHLYIVVGAKGTIASGTLSGTTENNPTRGGGAAAVFGFSHPLPAPIASGAPFPLLVAGGGGGYSAPGSTTGASGDATWTGDSGSGFACVHAYNRCTGNTVVASASAGGSGYILSCAGVGPLSVSTSGLLTPATALTPTFGGGGGAGYYSGGCTAGGGGAGSSFVNASRVFDVSGTSASRCGDATVSLDVSFSFPPTPSQQPVQNCSMRAFPSSEVVGDVLLELSVTSEHECKSACCTRAACMGYSFFRHDVSYPRCSLLGSNITHVVPSNQFMSAVQPHILGM
jgi:hypothetical protein